MSGDLIQVQTTIDCLNKATDLANRLLEVRLAACVQISSPVTSCYVWNGEVRQEQEYVLAVKTIRAAWPRLVNVLREAHPYEVPQIIALPILEATDSFAEWVAMQIDIA